MFATWQGRIILSHKLWRVSFFFFFLLLCPASRRYFSQMPTEKLALGQTEGEREMDSFCLIRYTLRDSMENCGNLRTCLRTEKYLKNDKNSNFTLHIHSFFLCKFKLQIQLSKWPQLLRAFVGNGHIHSAGIHWTSASSTFSRSAFSSLNATAMSPLTITLSNKWPHWLSMVSAELIMSSKSSSCDKTTLG